MSSKLSNSTLLWFFLFCGLAIAGFSIAKLHCFDWPTLGQMGDFWGVWVNGFGLIFIAVGFFVQSEQYKKTEGSILGQARHDQVMREADLFFKFRELIESELQKIDLEFKQGFRGPAHYREGNDAIETVLNRVKGGWMAGDDELSAEEKAADNDKIVERHQIETDRMFNFAVSFLSAIRVIGYETEGSDKQQVYLSQLRRTYKQSIFMILELFEITGGRMPDLGGIANQLKEIFED